MRWNFSNRSPRLWSRSIKTSAIILRLLSTIPTSTLVIGAHRKPLKEYCIARNLDRFELDSLDRYIKITDHSSEKILRLEFQLLDVTLQVYRRRHKLVKCILSSRERRKSLLSQGPKFHNNVRIESEEMDLLKKAFISQARKIQKQRRILWGSNFASHLACVRTRFSLIGISFWFKSSPIQK